MTMKAVPGGLLSIERIFGDLLFIAGALGDVPLISDVNRLPFFKQNLRLQQKLWLPDFLTELVFGRFGPSFWTSLGLPIIQIYIRIS